MSYSSINEVPESLIQSVSSGNYDNVYMDPELKTMIQKELSNRATSSSQTSSAYDSRNVSNNDLGTYMANKLYGQSSESIGQDASDYANRVKSRLDKDYAGADSLRQKSASQVAKVTGASGLSGVNNLAMQNQLYNQGSLAANQANQDYQDKALGAYGRNISARQSGISSLDMGGRGLSNAATPAPTANYSSGLSIICTELYKQEKLSRNEYMRASLFGRKMSNETFSGYLTIAKPIVTLMKRSDKFSDLFIGWAKSLADNKPNLLTRILIPLCWSIGYVRKTTKKEITRIA